MPRNWQGRQKKLDKRTRGMRVSNRSIFEVDAADRKRNQKAIDKAKKLQKKGKSSAE